MINGQIKIWLPAIHAGSGADVYTQRLARALEHRGMLVEISWFPLHFEQVPFLLKNISPPPGTDIVFANSWNAFAFKRTGLPLIVIEHHCVFDPAFRPHKSMVQELYHRSLIKPFAMRSFQVADAVVAVSDFTARSLRQNAGLTNVEVIYNWVDTAIFCPLAEIRRISRPFRLLYVGNNSRRKGADLLVPIMRKLGASFELHFTAGLKSENVVRNQPNMVVLGTPSNEQLICAYQECDALLFPSRFEGFGYAALEAMACGKPVIASNNTALPEVALDGVTGILCDTDNTEAFVNACRLLAGNPSLCSDLGKAGRQRAIEQFSEFAAITRYLGLIDRWAAKSK